MKFTVKYFILIICVNVLDGVIFRCDYKYSELGWFKYHEIPAVWSDARSMCHIEGGTLASPTTAEIKNKMMQLTSESVEIFTGIHSTFSRGHYYTIDGIPLSDIPHEWAMFEPDNKNNSENCLTLNHQGKMSDVKCEELHPFICHKNLSILDISVCGTPDPGYQFDGRTNHCYKFHTEPRTFGRAHFTCSAEGGHLAIINSEVEAQVIRDLYAQYPNDKIPGTFGKDFALVGFHNWNESGDWRTIHGQPILEAGYNKWAGGEPNNANGGENCGSVHRNSLFNDIWCNVPFVFICEKKPDYPPVCESEEEEESEAVY